MNLFAIGHHFINRIAGTCATDWGTFVKNPLLLCWFRKRGEATKSCCDDLFWMNMYASYKAQEGESI